MEHNKICEVKETRMLNQKKNRCHVRCIIPTKMDKSLLVL